MSSTSQFKLQTIFLEHPEMCTGNYQEAAESSGNNKTRPLVGTKCIEPCIYQVGRWGISYCNTENDNWGAECVPCTGTKSLV